MTKNIWPTEPKIFTCPTLYRKSLPALGVKRGKLCLKTFTEAFFIIINNSMKRLNNDMVKL